MQILKDTVALAFVLLLALTLRIDTGSMPIDEQLATPAQASGLEAPQGEPSTTVEVEAQLVRSTDGLSECRSELPRRMLAVEQRLESLPQLLRDLPRLPHGGEMTIEIVPDAAAAPPPERAPGISC